MTTRSRKPSSVFFEVFALGQAVRQLLSTTMAGGPLSPEEYAVYSAIFEAESLTPTDMAERLSMPLTTVMERVRLLQERGHTRRMAHPHDGRSYHLVLTASGLATHRRANERFEIAYRAFLETHAGDEARTGARLAQLRADVDRATARHASRQRPR